MILHCILEEPSPCNTKTIIKHEDLVISTDGINHNGIKISREALLGILLNELEEED